VNQREQSFSMFNVFVIDDNDLYSFYFEIRQSISSVTDRKK